MEAEDDPRNKDLFFDGHHQSLSSTEAAYSPNAKRKVESGFGLFCVMRKRARGDDDDMSSSDFDYAEKVRNIPLLGDSSAAFSSLDEQLDVNVSTSEGRDAEADGEDDMSFSDIDAMIRRLNLIPNDSDSCLDMEERNMSKLPRHTLLGLEHCSVTSVPRGIISQGAIAVLHCRDSKHFIRKQEVIIGRSCEGMNVDIDLGKYGYGSKVSRRQALVKLEKNGTFSLKNLGKRHILVNGEKLSTGQIASLTSFSSVDIRGEVFVFKINKEAVRQFLKNNARRNSKEDTKFRWCE
ncbi:hypothetical protein F2Q68_00008045 [Brassica cretica]|uniref:FHA domain-containing protein n=1 Tax=Brassica cretica TaxID=69181 RepID=A0A8S9KVE4_BRACR|nr:hypothetical protein F2Q68_00008045 [Brassica cretica]